MVLCLLSDGQGRHRALERDDAKDVWDEKDEEDETNADCENSVEEDENEGNESDDNGRNPSSLEETGLVLVVRAAEILTKDEVENHWNDLNDPEEEGTEGEDETDDVKSCQVHRRRGGRARRSATRRGGSRRLCSRRGGRGRSGTVSALSAFFHVDGVHRGRRVVRRVSGESVGFVHRGSSFWVSGFVKGERERGCSRG